MEHDLYHALIASASIYYKGNDTANDFAHVKRVLGNAMQIHDKEGGNADVIVPSALFHEAIRPTGKHEGVISGMTARYELESNFKQAYDEMLLASVQTTIQQAATGVTADELSIEAKIIQDAIRLESLGAVGILRMAAIAGQKRVAFYNEEAPFAGTQSETDDHTALDALFMNSRNVIVKMHTETGKTMAQERLGVMREFCKQLGAEIGVAYPQKKKVAAAPPVAGVVTETLVFNG